MGTAWVQTGTTLLTSFKFQRLYQGDDTSSPMPSANTKREHLRCSFLLFTKFKVWDENPKGASVKQNSPAYCSAASGSSRLSKAAQTGGSHSDAQIPMPSAK